MLRTGVRAWFCGWHPLCQSTLLPLAGWAMLLLQQCWRPPMVGREYAAVLREAAEFFDAHPYLPIPEGAPSLMLFYVHPSPAEIRWLTAIVADEGFKVESSSS